VYETAVAAGGRKVWLIEEPVAAALGADLPIDEPSGQMVVDVGGGTTDIAVLSLGGVIQARSLRVAGNAMDEAIIRFIRRNHQLLVGESAAEKIKIEAGTASALPNGRQADIHIRGRDLRQGRQKSIVLGPHDIADALDDPIDQMAEFIQRALEDLPPDVSTDICERGIHLTGGGALLHRLDYELGRRTGVPFLVVDAPLQCVVRGTARVLASIKEREHLLINP